MKKIVSFLLICITATAFTHSANKTLTPQPLWPFIDKLDNKDLFITLIKHYYYFAQNNPSLQPLINGQLKYKDKTGNIIRIGIVSLCDIALQRLAGNDIDLISFYSHMANFDKNEEISFKEKITSITTKHFKFSDLPSLDKQIIAIVIYDAARFVMEFQRPILINILIDDVMQNYVNTYKKIDLPPISFLKNLGLSNDDIRQFTLTTSMN